jgi:adenylosuccinate lyase
MHELIREHSVAAGLEVKQNGRSNDLLQRLGEDARIPFSTAELEELLTDYQSFTGRAEAQTLDFLDEHVEPLLRHHQDEYTGVKVDLHV